jgi:hypothetical protein
MRKALALAVLAVASLCPGLAGAQNPPAGTPPPDLRAQMQAMRAGARTQSFAALTPAHRAKVQAIVDQFDSGAIGTPREAVQQIDAVLSPDESKAVVAIAVQMRANMRAAREAGGATGSGPNGGPPNGGPPNGAPPNGGPPNGGPPVAGPGGGPGARQPDAGRFLLMMAANPAKMRGAMRPPPPSPQ